VLGDRVELRYVCPNGKREAVARLEDPVHLSECSIRVTEVVGGRLAIASSNSPSLNGSE
jgi:hypothetical protein